ncbi:uncharacterized protein [Vulpes vulpes]|uniref:Uncharacterized protein n=1 Tax=Vulpes vulpes TaxID=9627 RepID=A0ABM5AB14_VULVU
MGTPGELLGLQEGQRENRGNRVSPSGVATESSPDRCPSPVPAAHAHAPSPQRPPRSRPPRSALPAAPSRSHEQRTPAAHAHKRSYCGLRKRAARSAEELVTGCPRPLVLMELSPSGRRGSPRTCSTPSGTDRPPRTCRPQVARRARGHSSDRPGLTCRSLVARHWPEESAETPRPGRNLSRETRGKRRGGGGGGGGSKQRQEEGPGMRRAGTCGPSAPRLAAFPGRPRRGGIGRELGPVLPAGGSVGPGDADQAAGARQGRPQATGYTAEVSVRDLPGTQ